MTVPSAQPARALGHLTVVPGAGSDVQPATSGLRVVLVLGGLRSGSTLLGSILGATSSMVTIGEARNVWRAFARDERCSCGARAHRCPTWAPIGFELGYLGATGAAGRIERLRTVAEATLRLPRLMRSGRSLTADELLVGSELARLYATAADHAGVRTVVDTGKTPNLARVVAGSGLSVSAIHLVRDPRGVVISEGTTKLGPHGDAAVSPPRRALPQSAVHWAVTNSLVERELRQAGGPQARLRYEDLVEQPLRALDTLAANLGLGRPAWPLRRTPDGTLILTETGTHQLCGNPDRFKRDGIELRADERWRSSLTAPSRFGLELGLRPWMRRYGYDRA